MNETDVLQGKRILVVDDEPDILESAEEVLENYAVDTAQDFNTAERMLNSNPYDLAVLDIMGVRGYDLLKIARQKKILTAMPSAPTTSPNPWRAVPMRICPRIDFQSSTCFWRTY